LLEVKNNKKEIEKRKSSKPTKRKETSFSVDLLNKNIQKNHFRFNPLCEYSIYRAFKKN